MKATFLLGLLLLSLFSHCGRKPRSIIPSEKKETVVRPSRLAFPPPHGITLQHTKEGHLISWDPIPTASLPSAWIHSGYHLYRFAEEGFLGNKPHVVLPITQTSFLDNYPMKKYRSLYLLRAAFAYQQLVIEGPASQIVFG